MALLSAALPFACLDGSAVHAQSIMRSPSINIGSRIPTINPTVAPRINPNIAAGRVTGVGTKPRSRISYHDGAIGIPDLGPVASLCALFAVICIRPALTPIATAAAHAWISR